MRGFVTGATGFIGSAIVQELRGAGHQVLGLARSEEAAQALTAAGAEVHRGTLDDLASLRRGAAAAEGVIHVAFVHDFAAYATAGETDHRAIEAIGAELAGSGRPFVVTSGTLGLPAGHLGTEAEAGDPASIGAPRVLAEEAALALAARGVRVSVVRLPPTVHGDGDHGFVLALIGVARQRGVSAYVGDGQNSWPAVHRLDAAQLFRLALERGVAGARYHGVAEEGVPVRAIAEIIGRRLHLPVVSKPAAEAADHFGWLALALGADNPASSTATQHQLDWHPSQPALLPDLDRPAYFNPEVPAGQVPPSPTTTLPLVDPAYRPLVAQFPVFDPIQETVEQWRARVNASYAQLAPPAPVPKEERTVPGPAAAPAVRVLLYRPAPTGQPLPAILYLHGGGMVAGTPDVEDAASLALAQAHGALVVAIDYRLAPETPFPGPVEDCYAALDWLFTHAAEVGVDPARIVVMGESGGGGLAAALTLLTRDRGQHTLRGQVLSYPMLDSRTGTAEAPVDNPMTGEFVWTRAANQFGWHAMRGAAPIPPAHIGHFAPALAEELAGLPPTFIGVGALDLFLEEDVAYALRLARASVPVAAHVYPGSVHAFNTAPGGPTDVFNADLKAFLDQLLHT